MTDNTKYLEVLFKRDRRVIFKNKENLVLKKEDYIIVEADRGVDIGRVGHPPSCCTRGSLDPATVKNIIRLANPEEIEKLNANRQKEKSAKSVCKERVVHYKLDMKVVDVEYQYDGSKITFYFTASQRVDFRELVKNLASIYKTRIELRQIGVRDEAKRLNGVGSCGRELCCSTFLKTFDQITTQMAKDQQLSLNPTKISGNCGRLLCCLKFEEETYEFISKDFPSIGSEIGLDDKVGIFIFLSIFEKKGQVRFQNGSYGWYTAEELRKGLIKEYVQEQH